MKDKTTAGVLGILLGGLGIHKFYLGQTLAGVFYVLFCWTFIPSIVGLIEGISYLTMSQGAFDMKFNGMMLPGAAFAALPQPNQNIVVNVTSPAGAPAPAHAAGGDTAAQLKALHQLKLDGALTDEEFAAEKRKLLSR